jgi:hypothetical protein
MIIFGTMSSPRPRLSDEYASPYLPPGVARAGPELDLPALGVWSRAFPFLKIASGRVLLFVRHFNKSRCRYVAAPTPSRTTFLM